MSWRRLIDSGVPNVVYPIGCGYSREHGWLDGEVEIRQVGVNRVFCIGADAIEEYDIDPANLFYLPNIPPHYPDHMIERVWER